MPILFNASPGFSPESIFNIGFPVTAEPRLQEIIDRQTDPWGIKVTAVEVRDVILPDSMKRAMAGQAESERERRAKIINAEGEFQAAEKLVQAAAMISAQPIALQLRFLQAGFDRNGLYLQSFGDAVLDSNFAIRAAPRDNLGLKSKATIIAYNRSKARSYVQVLYK